MKAILFALLFALPIVGYGKLDPSSPEVLKDAVANAIDVSKLKPQGGVFYLPNTQEPFSGFAKQLYESGQFKELTQLKNGKADGLYKEWYEDGSKLSECTYLNGKKNGTDTVWRSDGSKVREISYKKGEKHGQEALYNMDGSKWSEISYLNGKKHGECIQIVEDSDFYEKQVFQYENGKANGMAIAYNKDGSRKWETVWKNDKFISTKRFKATSTADKTSEIKADQLEERRGVWYAKGKAEQFNGASVTYYPNGSKKINYLYVNGKKHGPATLYNEDGTKKKRVAYKESGLSVSNESKPDIVKLTPQDVFGGKYHEVKRKLENGADPDAILLPKGKRTALHCCCMGGRVSIVKLLLANGAKPNVLDRSNMAPLDILFSPDKNGRAPLERMSAENQLEIQRMLEKAGGKRKRHPEAHVQKVTRREGKNLADFLPGKKIYYWSPPPGESLQKNKRPNSVLRFSKEGPWDMGMVFSDKEVFPLSDLPEVLAKQVYAVDGLQVELGGEMMAGVKAGIVFSSPNPRKGEEMVLTTEGQESVAVTISWISEPGSPLPDDLQFDSQEVPDATVRDDGQSQRPKPKNIKASLWDATLLGWKSVVQQHVDAGTDLNEVIPFSSPPKTALDMAIKENHAVIADLLRKNGAMTVEELKAERDK